MASILGKERRAVVEDVTKRKLYAPLKPRQIRLFCARLTSERSIGIHHLDVFDLDNQNHDRPDYLAISYTWGTPTKRVQFPMTCLDNSTVPIEMTESCIMAIHDILQSARAAGELEFNRDTDCWIDQICIDQSNEAEKAEQIMLMKDIYERAKSVTAWLGSPSDDSDPGMDMLVRILEHCHRQSDPTSLESLKELIGNGSNKENVYSWTALGNLVQRPYFRRGWIVQEITAQPDLTAFLVCGRKCVNLTHLLALIELSNILETISPVQLPGISRVIGLSSDLFLKYIAHFRHMRWKESGLTLLRLAQLTRFSDLTDERDRLGCLLSFANDTATPNDSFNFSYSWSPATAFKQFALWHIATYHNLDILSYVSECTGKLSGELPSWVPDWTSPKTAVPFQVNVTESSTESEPLFFASGPYVSSVTLTKGGWNDVRHLAVSGVKVCTISCSSNYTSSVANDNSRLYRILIEPDDNRFGDAICPVTSWKLNQVFALTVYADTFIYESEGSETTLRRARLSHAEPSDQRLDEGYFRLYGMSQLADVAVGRHLFRACGDDGSFLIGIGPDSMLPNDQVWMLKGVKVLYILREHVTLGLGSSETVVDESSSRVYEISTVTKDIEYQVISEAFVFGLMDGEILEMMGESSRRTRPSPLKDMDRDFQTIYLR